MEAVLPDLESPRARLADVLGRKVEVLEWEPNAYAGRGFTRIDCYSLYPRATRG